MVLKAFLEVMFKLSFEGQLGALQVDKIQGVGNHLRQKECLIVQFNAFFLVFYCLPSPKH